MPCSFFEVILVAHAKLLLITEDFKFANVFSVTSIKEFWRSELHVRNRDQVFIMQTTTMESKG